MTLHTLSPAELRLTIDPESLSLADTRELVNEPLPWIGQARAEAAARFGLQMDQPDYHLFVLGEVGSGRRSLLQQMMQDEAGKRPTPPDLCYLFNVDAPEHPIALRLPAGEGRLLRRLMTELARRLQADIPRRLVAQDVQAERDRLLLGFKAQEDEAYEALSAFAEARNFALLREQGRIVFTQRDEAGQPMTAGKALGLSREQRNALDQGEAELRNEISRFLERLRGLEREQGERLVALHRQTIKPLLEHELQAIRAEMRKNIKDSVKLGRYLDSVQRDLLDNLALFQDGNGDIEDTAERLAALAELLARLQVNLVVDNHGREGAPVIMEDNPVFRALFGSIEYESADGVLATDFSRIRAGSLLRAHGGFLMLQLRDLLADEPVWERLRRFLRSGRVQIEEPGMLYAPVAAVSLEPEPVDVDVKIVLVASADDYYLVQEADPEFARRFRCKVDFAERFEGTPEARRASAVFVAHTCARLGLPHFDASAVAVVIEAMHREAADQTRQSALFAHAETLVIESGTLAARRGAALTTADDVHEAQRARTERHNHPQQLLMESLKDGERLLAIEGERVGQVNGLSVVDLGDHAFGFPVRVTARTHAGDEGLLNIEREVQLSGPIHDKGVMILHSHLSALFAHIAPLALSAAVVFEQEYHGVEGDSASCAEFYSLLSSLANLPLRQGLAVTGAINQHGEVLPVGGINEKIEGYFDTCALLGLTGRQGVLMPRRNVRHLMLAPRVVQAVAEGRFHVHAVGWASEGMALLTGTPYGELAHGRYPPDSVLGRAQHTLEAYRRACDASGAGPSDTKRGRSTPRPLSPARR